VALADGLVAEALVVDLLAQVLVAVLDADVARAHRPEPPAGAFG
jgi:hypothetical protein